MSTDNTELPEVQSLIKDLDSSIMSTKASVLDTIHFIKQRMEYNYQQQLSQLIGNHNKSIESLNADIKELQTELSQLKSKSKHQCMKLLRSLYKLLPVNRKSTVHSTSLAYPYAINKYTFRVLLRYYRLWTFLSSRHVSTSKFMSIQCRLYTINPYRQLHSHFNKLLAFVTYSKYQRDKQNLIKQYEHLISVNEEEHTSAEAILHNQIAYLIQHREYEKVHTRVHQRQYKQKVLHHLSELHNSTDNDPLEIETFTPVNFEDISNSEQFTIPHLTRENGDIQGISPESQSHLSTASSALVKRSIGLKVHKYPSSSKLHQNARVKHHTLDSTCKIPISNSTKSYQIRKVKGLHSNKHCKVSSVARQNSSRVNYIKFNTEHPHCNSPY